MSDRKIKDAVIERRQTVTQMAGQGLTGKQIASILGVSRMTISRDLHGRSDIHPKKSDSRNGAKTAKIDIISDTPCTGCTTKQEQWQQSVMNMAGESVSLPPYWSQLFTDEWRRFNAPSDLKKLARQAADMWVALANDLEKRGNRS